MKYSSDDDGKIYQQRPVFRRPSHYKPKGWTETVEGYLYEANKLTRCILKNERKTGQPCQWFVTVCIEMVQEPGAITDLWTKTCRKLRSRGVVALWVREPTPSNKVHYHVLLKQPADKREVRRAFKEAMPHLKKATASGVRRGWHMGIRPITHLWRVAHYVTKAKMSGRRKGRRVEDVYAAKRLLFKSHLGMKKIGEIGQFWEKSRGAIWDEIKTTEARIGEGLDKPDVRRLAHHAHEFIGGFIPREKVERSIGYWCDEVAVQEWIAELLAGEWTGEEDLLSSLPGSYGY